ncbi:MAG: hypothetical protein HC925_04365 [Coleofasciculaceae cyanobacterium SM2_3_26]|nr:hypothetical protein [Coleofasciculaceae cyanobacterium SM2_3_26]
MNLKLSRCWKDADIRLGGGGNDYLRGGRDEDFVAGEAGDDILNGNIGADLVNGGEGNDIVRGGRDNDVLSGGVGNDTLIGDVGADVLAGNEGSDLFALRTEIANAEEADLLLDFNPSEDRIGLTGGVTEAALQFQDAVLPWICFWLVLLGSVRRIL